MSKAVIVSPIGGVYSTDQIATILGVHRHTVQRLIRSGELGAIKVGRRLRVTDEQLRAFVQRQQIQSPQTEETAEHHSPGSCDVGRCLQDDASSEGSTQGARDNVERGAIWRKPRHNFVSVSGE
jgi:excisionase family DNA binding protein